MRTCEQTGAEVIERAESGMGLQLTGSCRYRLALSTVNLYGIDHSVSKENLYLYLWRRVGCLYRVREPGGRQGSWCGGCWAGLQRAHPSDLRRQPRRDRGTGRQVTGFS